MKRAIILLAACAPSAPETPSYQQHVAPILAANCIRCHGTPVLGGAPQGFRLDTYNSYSQPKRNSVGTEVIAGAKILSQTTAIRVASSEAPMPPRFPIDDYQIETLENWDKAGAPRGAPNAGNRAPNARVRRVQRAIEEEGVEIRVHYLIDVFVDDADGDVAGGVLQVSLGATTLPLGLIHSGPNHVAWETTFIAPGTFVAEAVIDDGGAEIVVPLGTIDVEAP